MGLCPPPSAPSDVGSSPASWFGGPTALGPAAFPGASSCQQEVPGVLVLQNGGTCTQPGEHAGVSRGDAGTCLERTRRLRCWCVHLQGTGGHRPTVKQTRGGRGIWPRATTTPKGAAGAPPPSEGHPGASWGTRTPLGRRRVSHELVPDCVSGKLGCGTGRPPASSGKQAHSLPVVGEGPHHPRGAAARSAPPAPTLSEQFLVFSCSKCKVG